jgi:hypothetical protein
MGLMRSLFARLGTAPVILLIACGGGQAEPTAPPPQPQSSSAPAPAEPASEEPIDTPEPVAEGSGAGRQKQPETAPPPADKPSSRETRTADVIANTVLDNRQIVRDCYEIARQDEPTLSGTLTVHFELDPAGKVSSAELNEERSTLKDPGLVSCALDAFRSIRFPPSSRGYESVGNYPFDFRP